MNDRTASPAVPDGNGLERLQMAGNARLRAGRMTVILAGTTWLPQLVLAVALPFLPPVFLVMPAREVLQTLLKPLV